MKKCSKCGVTKEKKEFGKHNGNKDNLQSGCRVCNRKSVDKWKKSNSERVKANQKKWREANLEKDKANQKKWREANVEKIKKQQKKYHADNKTRIRQVQKDWVKNNREKIAQTQLIYKNARYKNDDLYRLKSTVRARIWSYLKGTSKSKSTIEYLGCDIEFYKEYLTKQFSKDMSWENYGEYWEIDHIHPVSKGGSFHYSNTQPLTVTENREKRDNH